MIMEYKVVKVDIINGEAGLRYELDQLGKDGFDLVSVYYEYYPFRPSPAYAILTLKRPTQSPPENPKG